MNKKLESAKEKEKGKGKFVKVTVVDGAAALMQCGGGPLCNESK